MALMGGKERSCFILTTRSASSMRPCLPSRAVDREERPARSGTTCSRSYCMCVCGGTIPEMGRGGVGRLLAWELSSFNSSGYKKCGERDQGTVAQNTSGSMLSFVSRTERVAFGRKATSPLPLVSSQKGILSPSSFFFSSKDICH